MCVCLPNSTQNCQKGFTKGQRDGRAKTIQVVSNLKILKGSMKNKVSNVQFFGDVDVKLLPNIVEAVQKYVDLPGRTFGVWPLSIVYEVMRKWEKVFPVYEQLGSSSLAAG